MISIAERPTNLVGGFYHIDVDGQPSARCKHGWYWTIHSSLSAAPCCSLHRKEQAPCGFSYCDCRTHEPGTERCERPYTPEELVEALALAALDGVLV
jgi:hypothetical protein